jgi:uncharacterized FlaG/YvyC family protein
MDVQNATPVTTGTTSGVTTPSGATEVTQTQDTQQTQATTPASSSASSANTASSQSNDDSTISKAIAKLYNVTDASGEPQELSVSYKYVSELHLVVTVFTNPQTGEEVAQYPPQELIGLAELFDQIDGVTLDQKV